MIRFLWKKAIRAGSWLSQATGGWGILSKTWRWIGESSYQDYPIRKYRSLRELENAMGDSVWESDASRLGDSISYPGAIQKRMDAGEPIGDCDDFAVYCANVIRNQFGWHAKILAVQWVRGWSIHGHAVCLFFKPDRGWYMIGNWYGGRAIGPFPGGFLDVAKTIVRDAQGEGRERTEIISYAIFDAGTLENISFHPQV